MAKTRVLSQSKAVYVTQTGVFHGNGANPSGVEATQLHRVDKLSFEVDIAGSRQDIREFGQLARIGTIVNSDLTPKCSIGYLLTDGENEHHLGLEIKKSIGGAFDGVVQCISGFLAQDQRYNERNIFAVTVAEGKDAFASSSWTDRTEHDVVGFGNAFITDYSVDLSVGEIPRADVSFDCGNIRFYTGDSAALANPSLNPSLGSAADTGVVKLVVPDTGNSDVDVLRAGQIVLDLQDATDLGIGGANLAQMHPQSVSISLPLGREALQKLGSDLPYSRPLTTPIDVTLSVNAIMASTAAGSTSHLLTGCGGQVKRNISIKLYDRCDPTQLRLGFLLKSAVLDSQNFSQDLDGNETVDLQFSAQIAGTTTTDAGLFMTGSYATVDGSPLTPVLVAM